MAVGIRDVIVESMVVSLTADCITAVAGSDQTLVSSIKPGKMIDDPTLDTGNHIRIFYGDPRMRPMRWRDEAVQMRIPSAPYQPQFLRYGGGMEAAEIGGGEQWWRRFMLQIISNYTQLGYTQDAAREYANAVLQRVRKSLRDNSITGSDDFDEAVMDGAFSKVRWEETFETGGDQDWIWRSFIGVEVLTYIG